LPRGNVLFTRVGVTKASVHNLPLAEGKEVFAVIKASSVMLAVE
jgi:molybdopterin-binding protein